MRRWTRCSRAISSSSARTRWPSRTTSSPADVEPVDPVRRREDEPGDRVGLGAAELEPVRPPDGDVGPLPRRELSRCRRGRAPRAAARPEPQRLAHGHRPRPAAAARDAAAPASPRRRGRCARSRPSRRRRARPARPRRPARAPARPPPRAAGSRSGSARPRPPRGRTRRCPPAERWTQCAHQTSPATQPSSARYSTGGSRTAPGSTRPPRRSRRGACAAAARACRASAADSTISSFVTENGEQGATASCTIPSSSWSPASRSVSASTSSIDSTSESGGSPPSDSPRSIEPARGDDPHAELARRLHLGLPQPRHGRAGRRSGGRRPSCSRTARARRGPVRAAAYSASASIRAHTG